MQIKWKQHAKRINKRTNLLRETLLINHYSIYAYGFMRNMSLRCDIEWHMLLQRFTRKSVQLVFHKWGLIKDQLILKHYILYNWIYRF